ncbi:hypothetical protein RND81_02G041000 [Saponaria officinalis]|uniref:RING-type E3 ubiquitin transferase n=1 Tax=Saponaria officinalis TaxID=3572 RepID=A0AAW1MS83_SAPOF
MAEVPFLHLPEDDHDLFLDEFSSPTCDFDLSDDLCVEIVNENDVVSSSERKNQVNFVMDLFHQRVEESNLMGNNEIVSNDVNESTFGVIGENSDVRLLESDLGLGLGLVDEDCDNHVNDDVDVDDEYNFGGFVVSDCGDDFYVARRRDNVTVNCDEGSSRVSGLRPVWIESDSDVDVEVEGIDNVLSGMNVNSDEEEDFGVGNLNDDRDHDDDDGDLSVTLCWDSFHLEENDDNVEVNHDFEWEEVDDSGVDERDVSSYVAEDGSVSVLNISGLDDDGGVSNLEWEVLLNHMNMNNIDHDDNFYAAEYEMMFGQFVDGEGPPFGRPPASKAVVENLPSVVITKEYVIDEKSLCAVCKDHIEVGEKGRKLPCSHLYHGDCIIPWLGIRNTCPVCRFELPTDDPDYERRRTRSSARVA